MALAEAEVHAEAQAHLVVARLVGHGGLRGLGDVEVRGGGGVDGVGGAVVVGLVPHRGVAGEEAHTHAGALAHGEVIPHLGVEQQVEGLLHVAVLDVALRLAAQGHGDGRGRHVDAVVGQAHDVARGVVVAVVAGGLDGLRQREAHVEVDVAVLQGQLQGQLDEGVLPLLLHRGGTGHEVHGRQRAAAGQPEAGGRQLLREGHVEVLDLLVVRQAVHAQARAEAHVLVEPVGVAHAEAQRQARMVAPCLVTMEGHGPEAQALEIDRQLVRRRTLRLHDRHAGEQHRGCHCYCCFR